MAEYCRALEHLADVLDYRHGTFGVAAQTSSPRAPSGYLKLYEVRWVWATDDLGLVVELEKADRALSLAKVGEYAHRCSVSSKPLGFLQEISPLLNWISRSLLWSHVCLYLVAPWMVTLRKRAILRRNSRLTPTTCREKHVLHCSSPSHCLTRVNLCRCITSTGYGSWHSLIILISSLQKSF